MNKPEFKEWYKKKLGFWIPDYGLISLIACFLANCLVYWGTQFIMKDRYHYDLTSVLDRKIPFIKEWVIIYLGCYIFWVINYILIIHEGKEKWFKFVFADILGKLLCGVIFIILPTTNIRPAVAGNDIFSILIRFVYYVDLPTNLFPSLHCLMSWNCFLGIRRSKKVPFWYRFFSCIFAIMVCLSTQFTKQHYLIDVAGGILLAELCYYISCHTQIYLYIEKMFLALNERIFGDDLYDGQT